MLLLTPDENRFYQQESDKIGGIERYLQRVWPYRFILTQAIAYARATLNAINIAIGLDTARVLPKKQKCVVARLVVCPINFAGFD